MWRELFCQISIQYSPTYGPVFRGDQIDVDLINKSFPVTVTEKWNILVGLTRNNRGNDQGTRGTFHRVFCANIRTLFLDIFCLIFPFLFLLFSFLFISPCYETPVARYQSTFRQNARPLSSVWNPTSSPGVFPKKMGGLVWNLDLKGR